MTTFSKERQGYAGTLPPVFSGSSFLARSGAEGREHHADGVDRPSACMLFFRNTDAVDIECEHNR